MFQIILSSKAISSKIARNTVFLPWTPTLPYLHFYKGTYHLHNGSVLFTQPPSPPLFPLLPCSNHNVLAGAALLRQTLPQATVDWSRSRHLTQANQTPSQLPPPSPTGTQKFIALSLVAGAVRYEKWKLLAIMFSDTRRTWFHLFVFLVLFLA